MSIYTSVLSARKILCLLIALLSVLTAVFWPFGSPLNNPDTKSHATTSQNSTQIKTYGPVIIDLDGKKILPEEERLLQHPNVGGVILFDRNYETKTQLCDLIQNIRKIRNSIVVVVDQEGGFVQRFQRKGFRAYPAARVLGDVYDIHPEVSLTLAKNYGKLMAEELLSCGVDLSLGPVVDIHNNQSSVIGGLDRAFHANPLIVLELANAYIEGMNSAGMNAIAKHFPGHGSTVGDSHEMQPKDHRTYEEIAKKDLYPFIQLIQTQKLKGMIPAHILYPAIDKDHTVGYSKIWLQEILREKLGFQGAIISDCLSMKGAAKEGTSKYSITDALSAGCDMVILSRESRKDLLEILNKLSWDNKDAQQRIEALRGKG